MKKHTLKFPILLISLMPLLWHCTGSKSDSEEDVDIAKKSFTEKEVVRVKTTLVRKGDFAQELVSNGKLSAKEKALIPFLVSEQITEVKVHNGQRVAKGAHIARLESFTYRKRLDDASNQYEKARIDLEDHLLGYGYALKDTAKVPANILKMARIRSGYNQALSNLKEAKRNYAATFITAPFSGVIANLKARAYNPSSQYKYCCEVIADAVMHVEFTVLEGEMDRVKKDRRIEVFPFANKSRSYSGHITAVNPSIDEYGMISVTAEVKNSDGTLIDGMNVKVLAKNNKAGCIIIPKSAVLYRQNRKVVFVKDKGIANWVYVEVGDENSTQVTIVDESLHEGQEVIISNNLNLAHETPVVSE